MGKIMTGRKAYGEYENAISGSQTGRREDPLAELARIVSDGDEFLRQHGLSPDGQPLPEAERAQDGPRYDFELGPDAGDDGAPRDGRQSGSDQFGYEDDDLYGTEFEPYSADARGFEDSDHAAQQPRVQDGTYQDEASYDDDDRQVGAAARDADMSYGDDPAEGYAPETYSPDTYSPDTYSRETYSAAASMRDENGYSAQDREYDPDALFADWDQETPPSGPSMPDIELDPAILLDPYYGDPQPAGEPSYDTAGRDDYDSPAPEEDPYGVDPREVAYAASPEIGHEGSYDYDANPIHPEAADYRYDGQPDLVAVPASFEAAQAQEFAESGSAQPVKSRSLGVKAMAAVLALTVLGGGGLFAYRSMGGTGATRAPVVIKADTKPFKEMADGSGQSAASPGAKSGVYQRLSGENPSDKSQERIVIGKEQPVNVARAGDRAEGAAPASAFPKPVKTIVVKPDGTFVSRSETQTQTPATRPVVSGTLPNPAGPEKSGDRVGNTSPMRTVTTQRVEPASSEATEGNTAQQQIEAAETAAGPLNPVASDAAATTASESDTASVTPVLVKPLSKPELPSAPAQTRTLAPTQPRQTPAPATTEPLDVRPATTASTQTAALQAKPAPTVATGGYIVQVSSQRSQEQAQSAYADLQRRYSKILGGVKPLIQKADVGDRGTFYRVRLGPYQLQAANSLCGDLKSAGGDCFVRRN